MALCECGCGKPTNLVTLTNNKRGLKAGDHRRFLPGHQARVSREPIDQKYRIDPDTGCWEWLRAKVRGYGVVNDPAFGKNKPAHRYLYRLHRGDIPDGLVIDHLCRNHGCVNPWHLEPVTDGENVLRGIGPSATNARKTHCRQGHEFTPENTRVTGKKRSCRLCHRSYRKQPEVMARRRKYRAMVAQRQRAAAYPR